MTTPALALPLAALLALAVPADRPAPRTSGQDSPSLTGTLLVASESMGDPRFQHAVIYMIQHDASGALGLIVNRPVGSVAAGDLLRSFGRDGNGATGTIRVHYGGPVAPRQGFVLHTAEWKSRETQAIRDGIAVTAAASIFEAISHGAGPRRWLLTLGYAGWAQGQLEAEIEGGAWVTVPADDALVFDDDAASKWDRAMARRKITL
jgi:putative transcriptional regulator